MPLGTEVGLGPIDFVFDWNPAPPRKKGTAPTQFVANVYCYQMAGWMKTPLCMEVDVSQGHIVLDGDQARGQKGHTAPLFSTHVYCGHGRPSQLLLSSCSQICYGSAISVSGQFHFQYFLWLLLNTVQIW